MATYSCTMTAGDLSGLIIGYVPSFGIGSIDQEPVPGFSVASIGSGLSNAFQFTGDATALLVDHHVYVNGVKYDVTSWNFSGGITSAVFSGTPPSYTSGISYAIDVSDVDPTPSEEGDLSSPGISLVSFASPLQDAYSWDITAATSGSATGYNDGTIGAAQGSIDNIDLPPNIDVMRTYTIDQLTDTGSILLGPFGTPQEAQFFASLISEYTAKINDVEYPFSTNWAHTDFFGTHIVGGSWDQAFVDVPLFEADETYHIEISKPAAEGDGVLSATGIATVGFEAAPGEGALSSNGLASVSFLGNSLADGALSVSASAAAAFGTYIFSTDWIFPTAQSTQSRSASSNWVLSSTLYMSDDSGPLWNAPGDPGESNWLIGSAFQFDGQVPVDIESIVGIQVRVRASSGSTLDNKILSEVALGKNGSTLGTSKTPNQVLTNAFQDYIYGSETDLWGHSSWSLSDLTSSVQVRTWFSSTETFIMQVDSYAIKIFYTHAPEFDTALSSAGASTPSFVGASTAASTTSAEGVASASFFALAAGEMFVAADGAAVVNWDLEATFDGTIDVDGTSTVAFLGLSDADAVASAAGTSALSAASEADKEAAISSTASATSLFLALADGEAFFNVEGEGDTDLHLEADFDADVSIDGDADVAFESEASASIVITFQGASVNSFVSEADKEASLLSEGVASMLFLSQGSPFIISASATVQFIPAFTPARSSSFIIG